MRFECSFDLSPASRRPLRVESRPADGSATTRMAVYGELDMATAVDLCDTVAGAVATGTVDIELDLAGVGFVDSAGARCLLTCRETAERCGGQVRLSGPRPEVRRVLEVTGVLTIFGGHPAGAEPPRNSDLEPRPANATVIDARAIRQAARQARARAQEMRRADEARRARTRAARHG